MTFKVDWPKVQAKVANTINEVVGNMRPSGTVLVATHQETLYQQCFGYADVVNKKPMSIDTQLLVGSVTKQFTAVAILKALFDKNTQADIDVNDFISFKSHVQADLNNTIDYYLPEKHDIWDGLMPSWASTVTVHQLLVHSSGVPDYTSLPGFEKQEFSKASDLVMFFKTQALDFTPGTKFSYSNSGYFLLGIIVEQITNQNLDVYMQKTFFESLEMRSSFLATKGTVHDLIKTDVRFANLARGYEYEIVVQNASLGEVKDYVLMQIPGAAGSLVSTVVDLLKWNKALYSGKIIPIFLLELMLQPYMLTGRANNYYGYGVEIMHSDTLGEYYTYGGGISGFHSLLTFIPLLQITIAILQNITESLAGLMPEIEKIKAGLSPTLSKDEQWQQVEKIIESKYPCIIENRKRYLLRPVHDVIIKTLEEEIRQE